MSAPSAVGTPAHAAVPSRRPPLVRHRSGALVAGVAAGLAVHLGVPVRTVRVVLALSVLASGAGLLLYGWLWALVPTAADGPASTTVPPRASDIGRDGVAVGRDGAIDEARRGGVGRVDLVVGGLLVLAGLALLAVRAGVDVAGGTLLPLLVVVAGAALAYGQLDAAERGRWAGRVGRRGGLRVVGGVVLVAVGVLLLVTQGTDVALLGRALVAATAVVVGVGVVLAPWGVRLWRDLDAERAARAAEAARADVAAHLHDSVLQTLALVQRRSDDPAEVARLARGQERELRRWLYAGQRSPGSTVAAQVADVAAEVEDVHGVVVEVVTVGDRPTGPATDALVAALREAVVNVARHAEAPASVYVECGPDGVEAFVRDRGVGFDVAAVPPDRLGLRESVVGRLERHGGTARVRSAPGSGTEVRLLLPADVLGPVVDGARPREEAS